MTTYSSGIGPSVNPNPTNVFIARLKLNLTLTGPFDSKMSKLSWLRTFGAISRKWFFIFTGMKFFGLSKKQIIFGKKLPNSLWLLRSSAWYEGSRSNLWEIQIKIQVIKMWNICGSLRDHSNQPNDHLARTARGLIWVNDPKSKCPPSGMVGGGRGERPRTTISFEQVQISKNSERILVIICILHRDPDDNDMSV